MTHICVGNLTIIGSYNGLSPGRRQAIIWTNAEKMGNWTLGNKLKGGFNWNKTIFIEENTFENVNLFISAPSGVKTGVFMNNFVQTCLSKLHNRPNVVGASAKITWWCLMNCIQQWEQMSISNTVFSLIMTSSNGIIFRVTGPLCGEFTGPRWIPLTKASDAELWCYLWSASE